AGPVERSMARDSSQAPPRAPCLRCGTTTPHALRGAPLPMGADAPRAPALSHSVPGCRAAHVDVGAPAVSEAATRARCSGRLLGVGPVDAAADQAVDGHAAQAALGAPEEKPKEGDEEGRDLARDGGEAGADGVARRFLGLFGRPVALVEREGAGRHGVDRSGAVEVTHVARVTAWGVVEDDAALVGEDQDREGAGVEVKVADAL